MRRLSGQRSTGGWVSEKMGGLSYLEYIRTLVARVESDWEGVKADLEAIRKAILQRPGKGCVLMDRRHVIIMDCTVLEDDWGLVCSIAVPLLADPPFQARRNDFRHLSLSFALLLFMQDDIKRHGCQSPQARW